MSGPNKDLCACGKYGLDSFIGTYGDHESMHTRGECRMDSGAVIAAAPDELAALRLSLAQAQAREARLREALGNYGEHERGCVRATYCAGRPTDGGGYEQQFGNVWYESRPVDRTPPCDCGLAAALSRPTSQDALRAFGERCVEAGQKDAFDEISAMDAGVPRAQQDAAAIVSRILGEDRT